MKLIVTILVLSILVFLLIKSYRNEQNRFLARELISGIFTKEIFEKATLIEKEELLNDFIFKIRKRNQFSIKSINDMPSILKLVCLINELETEVNNGGFFQFFANTSGEFTDETIEGLKIIGAEYTRNLLIKAKEIVINNHESFAKFQTNKNELSLHEIFQVSELYDNEEVLRQLSVLDMDFFEYTDDLSGLKMEYFDAVQDDDFWNEIEGKYVGLVL